MKVFGVAGWSGSGKTTLIRPLIAELRRRGLRVSTLKHSHHAVEVIDQPDDDARRLLAAGAAEVLVAGPSRWLLLHEPSEPPDLNTLSPRFADCDLLLVEGFKRGTHPKLEVYRADLGKPLLCPDDPHMVAIATTAPGPFPVPRFDPTDIPGIAAFMMRWS